MDPYSQQQSGHELPPSHSQGGMLPVAPNMQQAQPLAPIVQPLATPTTMAITQPIPQTSAHATSPTVADDLDLIEKEWVTKAKAIVATTRTDPHAQNDEMNKFKADYMMKRYGKDVKIEA